jgi:predicted ATPase
LFESVTIENFRGIEKLEVPLSPLTVLVGPNGVGKSSVLDAISLGGRSLHDSVETLVRSRRQGVACLRRAGAEIRVEIRSHRQVVTAKREDPSREWEAACQIGFGPTHNAMTYSGEPGPIPVQFVDSARPYDPRDMSTRITDIQRRGLKPQLEAFLRALDSRIRSIGMDATSDGTA